MDTRDESAKTRIVRLVMDSADAPEPTPHAIDLTDQTMAQPFRPHDRVRRLNGDGEATGWGTIQGRVGDGDVWVVVDNLGVSHHDQAIHLRRARAISRFSDDTGVPKIAESPGRP